VKVPVVVAGLELDPRDGRAVVLLVHEASARVFPLWVTDEQAGSIARSLRGVGPKLASGGELVVGLLDALGARIEEVHLSAVQGGVVQAALVVRDAARRVMLSARAGDAVGLALVHRAVVLVPEDLLMRIAVRVAEAEAKTKRKAASTGGGSAEPVPLSPAERWSQLLAHLSSRPTTTYEG
jgi:hypothetical protein